MRSSEPTMVGGGQRSAPKSLLVAIILLLTVGGFASAQSLYKYRGPDGEWNYSDRPPDDDTLVEIRQLQGASKNGAEVDVTHEFAGRTVQLIAHNESYISTTPAT